jgi:hypothetical protein
MTATRGVVFVVAVAVAHPAPAVINPSLQPHQIVDRYKTALIFTIDAVDENTSTVKLAVSRVTKGTFAPASVTLSASADTMQGLLSLSKGQTVIAFVGSRRKPGEVFFYTGAGTWNEGEAAADKPGEWKWIKAEEGNNQLAGIFNGAAERLAELLADTAEGRGFFPAQPYLKFQDDRALCTFDQPARGVALADLDGDGKIDAVATSAAGVRVWLQRNGVRFEDATDALGLTGVKAASVAVADVDCTGHVDLLSDGMLWKWQAATKKFARTNRVPAIPDLITATFADIDGDGLPDVLAATRQGIRVYLNPGKPAGQFTDATRALGLDQAECGAGQPGLVAPGDLSGAGRIGLFVSCGKGILLAPDAKGVFHPRKHVLDLDLRPADDGELTGGAVFAPLWRRDAMALLVPRHAGFALVAEHRGKLVDLISYCNETSEPSDRQLWALAEDLNADGEVDIYTASGSNGSSDVCLLNRGYGSYMRPMKHDARVFRGPGYATGSWGAAAGDVDGDGTVDLLLGCADGSVRLLLNDSLAMRKDVDEVSASTYLVKLSRTKLLTVDVRGPRGSIGAVVTLTDAKGRVSAVRRPGVNSAGGSWSGGPLSLAVREPGKHVLRVRYSDGLVVTRDVDVNKPLEKIVVDRERN